MIRYLDYIKNKFLEVDPDDKYGFVSEIELGQKVYTKYKDNKSYSPIFSGDALSINKHIFNLHTRESFTITKYCPEEAAIFRCAEELGFSLKIYKVYKNLPKMVDLFCSICYYTTISIRFEV